MKPLGFICRVRMKKYRSYKGGVGTIAPNFFQQNFYKDKPNQKRVTDVTKYSLFGDKLYLSSIPDLCNRDLVNYEIEDTKQEAKKLRSKLDKAQQETITILGIFSAVVLAFMGGMSFSSSVLGSMYLSNVYKVSFICLLIGLVLVNLIYVLFTFIMHINKDRPFKWNRVIIVLDLILIGFMVVDLVAWAIDIKSLAVWIQKSLPWII